MQSQLSTVAWATEDSKIIPSEENDEKLMYVQNCVVNVYPKSSLKGFQPVQNNVYNSSPDYDAEIADDFFAKIAHLIP